MGDISQSYSGGTPSVGISSFYGGSIPFIRSGEINDEKTELFLTEEGLHNSSAKLVKYGDILYALYGATSGEVNRSKINGAINQAILAIIPNLDYCAEFIAQWLRKNKLNIISIYLQGGQGNLSAEIVKNLQIILPDSKEEQTAIGNFFKQLDDTIALHRRNCIKCQNLKMAYLESIFSAKYIHYKDRNKNAWEQRKLGEIYENNTERNTHEIGYDKTISIATMIYKSDGNGASLKSLSNYKVLRMGDIAFEGHTNKQFRYGRFIVNDIGIGIMSPRFAALRPKRKMPISFWKYYIHYEPIMRNVLVNATKAGTMMNELVVSEFLNQTIFAPSLEEQTVIGNFFKQLDDTIALHQRFWVNNNQFGREYAELF